MSSSIEMYGAVYDHPGKGHDRLFIDDEALIAGVFDGAGGDELSQAIVEGLPAFISGNYTGRVTSQALFLARLLEYSDNLPEARQRKSTAAIACVDQGASVATIAYANAGDSSMYLYNHDDDSLSRIAHTPTTHIEVGGERYINTTEFLGNFRDKNELGGLVGSVALLNTTEWSLIGFSDGVQDDDGQGIEDVLLKVIVKAMPAHEVPLAVLSAFQPYDDASVFILSHRLEK